MIFGNGAGAMMDPSGHLLVVWKGLNILLCRRIVENGNENGIGLEMVAVGHRVGQPGLKVVK